MEHSGHPGPGNSAVYRADIDGLRAVAVLGVVAYHFGVGGITGGYGGVDIFFVISGFLIAGLIKGELERGTFSLADFYVRRIRRILPALVVCMLTTTVAAALILFPDDFQVFGKSLSRVATATSNFYFGRKAGDYFGDIAANNPVLHTWSLSIEEQFYAVLPLFLLIVFKFRRSVIPPTLVAIALVSLAVSIRGVEKFPEQAFFSTAGRVWELQVGVFLAFGAAPLIRSHLAREAAAGTGAALIAFGYLFYTATTPFPGLAALPFCLGAALIIHAGNGQTVTAVGRVLSSPVAVGIGLISYSVYLWHWPLIVLARYRFPLEFDADKPSHFGLALLLVVLSLGLGYLSWRFVEKPFRRKRTNPVAFFGFRPQIAVFAVGAIAIVSLAGTARAVLLWPSAFQQWSPAANIMAMGKQELAKGGEFGRPVETEIGRASRLYEVGNAAAPIDTIFWGDSHVQAMLPGIARYADTSEQRMLVAPHPACAPLLGVTYYIKVSATCREINDSTLIAASSPNIKRIVFGGRWAAIADFVRQDEKGNIFYGRGRGDGSAFTVALERTVNEIANLGKEVVIIGPVPEQSFDVAMAYARHLAWGHPLPKPATLNSFLKRQNVILPLLARLDALPNVRVVYPHQHFCEGDVCGYMRDGAPMYIDEDHLNPTGALYLHDMYAEIFARPAVAEVATGSTK